MSWLEHPISTKWLYAIALIGGTIMLLSSTPVSATKGREAVGMCIDSTASGSRCAWNVNDKGEIDICNKNGCVYCPSATGDCKVVSRSRPRPRMSLPVGAKVETVLGKHEVARRPINDHQLLRDMIAKDRK